MLYIPSPSTTNPSVPPVLAALLAVTPLELCRRQIAERRVATVLIVEELDIVERSLPRLAIAFEPLTYLELERREPTLHWSIVEAIPSSAHAARDAVRPENLLIVLAGVRASPIRVKQ